MGKIFFLFAIVQILHFFSTWKLYVKAGRKSWEASIPIYNAVVLMQIINRPKWWVALLFIPVVNLILIPVIWVEIVRSFGKSSAKDTWLAIMTFGFYIAWLNYNVDKLTYIKDRTLKTGDFLSSILFAIVVATIVHTYLMQPFTIPTSSLEKTLLVGDYLFVSKVHYGARIPMTTIALPMVHDSVPVINIKSFLFDDDVTKKEKSWKNFFQLPYFRLPRFQKINRDDLVVFNQPADTLLDMDNFSPDRNYYKPIDKKTNLVKRCVAIPGDTLEIRNGYVYIDGKQSVVADRVKLQFSYAIKFSTPFSSYENAVAMLKRYDITDAISYDNKSGAYIVQATEENAARARHNPYIESLALQRKSPGAADPKTFPQNIDYKWNADFFGPIYIPQKGKTIDLNLLNLPIYKRLITEYESHSLLVKGKQIFIDGVPTTTYTFKQDYYWMMGDNRNNSLDARFWGFVPFDHVVGKPVFIWLSLNKDGKGIGKIRWERMFTTVSGEGAPRSYFIYFIAVVILYTCLGRYIKKKKHAL